MEKKSSFIVSTFDKFINLFRKICTVKFLDNTNRFVLVAGNIAVYLFMFLFFIKAVYVGIKYESFKYFINDFRLIIIIPIMHYVGLKLISSFDKIVSKSKSGISEIPNQLLAGLNVLAGIFSPIVFIILAINTKFVPFSLFGFIFLIVCFLWAVFSFSPETINMEVKEQENGAMDLVGILNYFFKAPLKAFPAAFGFIALFGSLVLFIALILLFIKSKYTGIYMNSAMSCYWLIIFAPVAVYFYSLLGMVFTGIIESVLRKK